jgi:ribosomal protein S18 acetylase RimI-like enzyme
MAGETRIRPMRAGDVGAATRIYRVAFGTLLKAPDPARFRLDIGTVETRFATDPGAALIAEREGRVVGSAFGMDWGSQFVVGPITVDPAHWRGGVARRLTSGILEVAADRKASLVSLFTHPNSTTHLRLYESSAFVPMFLTPILSKAAGGRASSQSADYRLYSALPPVEQEHALERSLGVTEGNLAGLDLRREIRAIEAQRLGETILLGSANGLSGMALCHIGAGTEAGDGTLFVKFAAVLPGAAAGFERLLDAIDALAMERGVERILAGVNTGRRDAYRRLLARGYRAVAVGVGMHRPDVPGTLRPDVYVIDDWR